MQQTKFTFSNSSNSYSISKASQPLPNQPKPIPTINFSSVHKTSKNHQDQHHNLSSNVPNFQYRFITTILQELSIIMLAVRRLPSIEI